MLKLDRIISPKGQRAMDNQLNYMVPDEVEFYMSDGDLLMLSYKGEDVGRVAVLRMFPLQYEDEYICVRKENYTRADKEKEVGIIRSLDALDAAQAEIIRSELKKRYFVPEILQVQDVKDEIGHTSWNVVTSAGKREFTVADMNVNVKKLADNTIMLTDVYGNRYSVSNLSLLGDKVMKILEIWI